jgi:expansin (peptidoglycan-binding protein)
MSSRTPQTAMASAVVAGALAILGATAGSAEAAAAGIPVGQVQNGKATYYNDAGYGACGTWLNAASEMLVAVSYTWWTTANPNNDPICQHSVQVTYNGKTITVPIRDKCPSCDATHIDLSQPAFQQFANTSVGVIPLTWKFL